MNSKPAFATVLWLPLAMLLLPALTASRAVCQVGPGMTLANIGGVAWESLQADDTVLIYWRANAHPAKWVLCRQGTAQSSIAIRGVPGPWRPVARRGREPCRDSNLPSRSSLPAGSIQSGNGKSYPAIGFHRHLPLSELTYTIQFSTDLAAWQDGGWWADSTVLSDIPPMTTMLGGTNTVVRLTAPLPLQPKAFLRVRVARPQESLAGWGGQRTFRSVALEAKPSRCLLNGREPSPFAGIHARINEDNLWHNTS